MNQSLFLESSPTVISKSCEWVGNPQEIKKAEAKPQGYVSLVGAGPNDPDLLTLKALKALQKAQVLVYDRLVGKEILTLANPKAEQVYVGKRCGQPSMKQETICALLVKYAQAGKNVVRLKGGDPFIFGRGGEEALELVKHHIPYQVIPGITAAIGCAASSFIPLTHRQVSRSVTFITGQVVTGALPAWAGLVASGQTLVFYMGLEKAASIEQGLIQAGLSPATPVAIIGHGCSTKQTVITFELVELADMAHQRQGLSPALIIMGDVVKLRSQLLQTARVAELQTVFAD
ncbi:uroporphyrinogen-III C-methyltransferase [Vibrio cincinnatiensis]|uniref:uroporphyrinogen-III C-methyltransferase n=1 Tax=Vibrio cincinnatiensis TaxID=675 RepID=UPI001EE0BC21|nr:uroporphyrinogen-III C-methyltransferase [Vibrio cincinnatiensis]MCG3765482.1 uroporphyrinogen-III C-methyltransferase [Vibrio cincinnatiensis]